MDLDRNAFAEFVKRFAEQCNVSDLCEEDGTDFSYWRKYEVPRWADFLQLVLESDPKRVLDVGCGSAICSVYLKHHHNIEVVGIEHPKRCERMGEYWQSNGVNVRSCDISCDPLPVEGSSFDVVMAGEIIEHLQLPAHVTLAKLLHALKPEGRIVVSTPNICRLSNILRFIQGKNILLPLQETSGRPGAHATDSWFHLREYTPDEVIEALQSAGFSEPTLRMSPCWDRPDSSGQRSTMRKCMKTMWYLVCRLFPKHLACIMATAIRQA